MPETAKVVASTAGSLHEEAWLVRADHNIKLGALYMRELLDKLGGNVPLAVGSYNAGPEAITRWQSHAKGETLDVFVETIPFLETRGYVVRVMGNLARYGYMERGEAGVPRGAARHELRLVACNATTRPPEGRLWCLRHVLGLFFAAVFIALNGFFVAAEFALVKICTTLANTQKAPREDPRDRRARRAVVSRLDRYLSVTQFGITLASLGLGWIGEPALEASSHGVAVFVIGHEPGEHRRTIVVVVIAFALLTFGHVLFGELVPKLVAIQRSEPRRVRLGARRSSSSTSSSGRSSSSSSSATRLILRSMGMSADAASEGTLSEDELIGILAANAARSPGGKGKRRPRRARPRFAQRTARHAMVPRVDVFTLPIATTGEEAVEADPHAPVLARRPHEGAQRRRGRRLPLREGLPPRSRAHEAAVLESVDARASSSSRRRRACSTCSATCSGRRSRSRSSSTSTAARAASSRWRTCSRRLSARSATSSTWRPHASSPVPNESNAWDVDARATIEELRAHRRPGRGRASGPRRWAPSSSHRLGRIPRIGDKVELGPDATAEVTSVSRRRIMRVRIRLQAQPTIESVRLSRAIR